MAAVPEYFGSMVFDDRVMKANLSADVYQSLKKTIDEGAKLNLGVANAVAAAMKDWAVAQGATTLPTGSSHSPASPPRSTTALSPPLQMEGLSWNSQAGS